MAHNDATDTRPAKTRRAAGRGPRRLVRRRSTRTAGAGLLLGALVILGTGYSLLSGAVDAGATTTFGAQASDTAQVADGKKIFAANCATCHGMNAEGRPGMAPSLIGVGSASVDFQVSTGRMPMQAAGVQAPAKQRMFDQTQTDALAAYVASLGPGPAVPSAELVDPSLGSASKGMALFRTNCAMCHGSIGSGGALTQGKFAPALGAATPTQIYEAMLTGPQSMPVFNDANISPEGKRDIITFLDEQKQGSPGGLSLGALGPVSEGVWVWIVGIGALIGAAVWIGAKSS